jgi:hypothetical protein
MTARRINDAAPLRFLLAIVCAWLIVRGAFVMGWQPPSDAAHAAQPAHPLAIHLQLDPVTAAQDSAWTPVAVAPIADGTRSPGVARGHAITVALDDAEAWGDTSAPAGKPTTRPLAQLAVVVQANPANGPTYRRADGLAETAALAARPGGASSRWSGSAWAFLRGGGRATALSPGGQIGGGQAGARLLYRLRPGGRLALSARVSGTIGGLRQTEAALGLDWQPIATIPIHLTAERRIAIDKGGRNAWTLGAAGGLYAVPLGGHWRFDGYAEAGIVGARRRDLYADGAGRIARAIDLGAGRSLALGGGLWAAAQPSVSRVDIGPSAVLRLPVNGRTIALALDWRQQIAGHARPHSGIAFTAGVDF